jgi:hypothetical protein
MAASSRRRKLGSGIQRLSEQFDCYDAFTGSSTSNAIA